MSRRVYCINAGIAAIQTFLIITGRLQDVHWELRVASNNFASLKRLLLFVKMKLQYVCLIFGIILCSIAMCEAYPFRAGNIDYVSTYFEQ